MMVDRDDDLGLSLGLPASAHHHRFPLQLNLMPSAASPCATHHQKSPWSDLLATPSASGPGEMGLWGIDVNRAPAAERESEEEAGVSSPNSTVSSVSGKRGGSERDLQNAGEHNEMERDSSRGISDDEDGGEGGSRKKLRLSKDQSAILEESFKEHNTLIPKQKLALAKQLNLRPRQVEVWFQNRRARTKLKQTEVDCEFLKRCCDNLTEENRRLQKEVQELRALKLSPQFYMHMTPPTTLTMCPSCERVSSSANATSTTKQQPATRPISAAAPAPWAPIPLRASFLAPLAPQAQRS